ncbi:hypothetical protein CANCADRAFT_23243 [Tortispora caseinolytica NRRL Y-17796]|uniref:Nodulin-like domain-containing protein n=1 Tax=Tortispora caseinolytica NRRL Y-17796 TaxID=767744 RepID=A0A1E4TLV8_9ASCO|nr:hypothetical protein CANCADRAFT_23243 [Tortispora caseinolytica NRRL Y-17796]
MLRQLPVNVQRYLSLAACGVICLAGGNTYVYSAYGPQLADRLGLSASQAATLALAGAIGLAWSGPVTGVIIDNAPSHLPTIAAALLMFTGYGIVYRAYATGSCSFLLLIFAMWMSGAGGSFASGTGIKYAGLNFPYATGSATAVPMTAFGLSALLFSTIAALFFAGDTQQFLLLLCLLPSVCCLLCLPFLHYVPAPPPSLYELPVDTSGPGCDDIEYNGTQILRLPIFWYHYLIISLTLGCGQMFILSCGYCIRALMIEGNVPLDSVQRIQSLQVGIVSMMSATGRLTAGVVSDMCEYRFGVSRTWTIVVAGAVFMCANYAAIHIDSVSMIWVVSALTGLGYGIGFGSYPAVVSKTFGMTYFSQNWGILTTSPIFGSYIFNNFFGHVYDSMVDTDPSSDKYGYCVHGVLCYAAAFRLTFFSSLLGTGLALYVILRSAKL